MNIQRIREMMRPFKPFFIHLSDGRKLAVPAPDFVAIGQNVVVVLGEHDRVNTLDPLRISGLEEDSALKQPSPESSGS